MAVEAQYHPSNVLLFNRGEEELKVDMDFPPAFHNQSPAIFFANGNARKRGRESVVTTAMPQQQQQQQGLLFSLQQDGPVASPTFISLAQLQNQQHPPPLVSTGLRLAFDGQNQNQNNLLFSASPSSSSMISNVLSDELAGPLSQQKDEIDQLLAAQGEQLRRALGERWQRHCRALVVAAEEAAGRKMREKEVEVERAARRGAELEDRLARLRAESMAWQAKAMADQAAAAALHAQLQLAAAAAVPAAQHEGDEESPEAEDCESAHVDPDRAQRQRACRACRGRPASVVLLPCRHLCLCSACDAGGGGGGACPVCRCHRTSSVQVFLS